MIINFRIFSKVNFDNFSSLQLNNHFWGAAAAFLESLLGGEFLVFLEELLTLFELDLLGVS